MIIYNYIINFNMKKLVNNQNSKEKLTSIKKKKYNTI
jgi:hypothetical protein